MSELRVFRDDRDPAAGPCETYTHPDDIARVAREAGVLFERWPVDPTLPAGAAPAAVLAAYGDAVARLQRARGFATADVVALTPDHPDRAALRAKFLDEHTHAEDEARFFVGGVGLFSVHHGGAVYALRCERGDLINVPAGTRHWFDMGPAPSFQCIRLFTDPRGWVAAFTGADIAARFPRLAP